MCPNRSEFLSCNNKINCNNKGIRENLGTMCKMYAQFIANGPPYNALGFLPVRSHRSIEHTERVFDGIVGNVLN
jgi:hypothetical protein